jgi:integrase
MPREHQGQAVKPTKSARSSFAGHGQLRCRVGWRRLRLGVGHASTARPDPSTLGAVGERGPLREQKFVAGIFKPAAVRAGLFVTRQRQPGTDREVVSSDLRFHDLRHTCASLLIAQGASVKAVQAQLGHASATVTLDRYGHLFPDDLQQLADRLQDAYAQAITDPARTEGSPTMLRDSKEAGQ